MGFFTEEQLEQYVQQRIQEAMGTSSTPNNEESEYRTKYSAVLDRLLKWMDENKPTTQGEVFHKDPSISMEVERNSKGYNWRVKVADAPSVEEAMRLLKQGQEELKAAYGEMQCG